jgi:hypothetical protein
MDEWIINIIDKIGFSCYDVIDIQEVVDLGDTYDLITGRGDIFLEKDYCIVNKKIINEYSYISTIEYNTDYLNVYMERLEPIVDEMVG